MIARSLVTLVCLAASCAALIPTAGADTAASRIIDRTFSCEVGYLGGIYQATVESYWFAPPQAERRIPSAAITTNLTNGFLGGISSSSIHVSRLHCKPSRAKLLLTTKGMSGGQFSPFGAELDCYTSRRVLLRIRSEFLKPTVFKTASPYGYPQLQALGATKQTELAVGTPAGKPIAYASIVGVKKARLFTSSNCKED